MTHGPFPTLASTAKQSVPAREHSTRKLLYSWLVQIYCQHSAVSTEELLHAVTISIAAAIMAVFLTVDELRPFVLATVAVANMMVCQNFNMAFPSIMHITKNVLYKHHQATNKKKQ